AAVARAGGTAVAAALAGRAAARTSVAATGAVSARALWWPSTAGALWRPSAARPVRRSSAAAAVHRPAFRVGAGPAALLGLARANLGDALRVRHLEPLRRRALVVEVGHGHARQAPP